jgi:nucleotide-binding universal stress UspA family protein
MFTTVLVPLDGSALAERALPFAIRIGLATGARLLLVRTGLAEKLMNWNEEATFALAATQQAEQDLASLVERLHASGIRAEAHLRVDDATRAIVETARKYGAGLIVMTTHGRSGLGRWVYGSIAEQVLRGTPVPVLLIPAGCNPALPEDRPPRLLVPLDGSRPAAAALDPAIELAEALGGELLLLGVAEHPRDTADADLASTRQYLNRTAQKLRARGHRIATEVRSGEPAAVIMAVRRELDADVLVLATRGRGRTDARRLGPVVASIIQRSAVPILLVRPAALSRAPDRAPATGSEQRHSAHVRVSCTTKELALLRRGLAELLRRKEPPEVCNHGAAVLDGLLREQYSDTPPADQVSRLLARLDNAVARHSDRELNQSLSRRLPCKPMSAISRA